MTASSTLWGKRLLVRSLEPATGHSVAFNQLTINVQAEKIVDVVRFLRDDPVAASSTLPMSPRSTIPAVARSGSTSSIICCRRH